MDNPSEKKKSTSILITAPWDTDTGGVVSVAGYLGKMLQGKGYDVLFFHPGGSDVLVQHKTKWGFRGYKLNLRRFPGEGSNIRQIISFLVFLPIVLYQLRKIIKHHNIKVINIHYPSDEFGYFALMRHILPIKLILSIHGADFFPDGVPLKKIPQGVKMLIKASDRVIAPSQAFLDEFLELVPNARNKSGYIHNGIDVKEFNGSKLYEKGNERIILSIAYHTYKKGLDVLLDAFASVIELDETIMLYLIGDGTDRKMLEQQVERHNISNRVKFLGNQNRENISKYLYQCEIYVQPSRSEPFGIAAVEALSCGRPVIASNVGGLKETVQNGVNGLLVEAGNADALAQALTRLLSDDDLRKNMGKEGPELVKNYFTVERMGECYEKVFRELSN